MKTFNKQASHLHKSAQNNIDCCGGPARVDKQACCDKDEQAKAAGKQGCGCGADRSAVFGQKSQACC